MQIAEFTPLGGRPGTDISVRLLDVPADASAANTRALLCGQSIPVKSVTVAPDGSVIVVVTVGTTSQSGELHIVAGTARQDAQSAAIFSVETAASWSAITDVVPRTGSAGTTVVLSGRHLNEVRFITIGTTSVYVLPTHTATEIRFVLPLVVHPGIHRIYGCTEGGRLHSPYRFEVGPRSANDSVDHEI